MVIDVLKVMLSEVAMRTAFLYPCLRGMRIGLVGLLGVSLQLTLPSGCSVRYLRPLLQNNPENCETPSQCQTSLLAFVQHSQYFSGR